MPSTTNANSSRRRNVVTSRRLAPRGTTVADEAERGQRAAPSGSLRVRTKVWIETDEGSVLISEFRAGLLAAVDQHGSVAAAARALRLPYRTAWKKLEEMQHAAGVALLASDAGGAGGGQTTLTDAARAMLAAYLRISAPAALAARTGFERERAHFEAP